MKLQIVFFGSFQHYSVLVLEQLEKHFEVIGVVTTPPRPAGRHLKLTSTPVADFANLHKLPLFEPPSLKNIDPTTLIPTRPDLIVVAGYGKLIPKNWLDFPTKMAINMHPSPLPRYAGPMPGEWQILNGETQSAISLIQMSEQFDSGGILVQIPFNISPTETRETFYDRAFHLAADILVAELPKIASGQITPHSQNPNPTAASTYAKKLTREDGFVSWEDLKKPEILDKKRRAFFGWPGLWSINPSGKRVKIVSLEPIKLIEEGK